MSNDKIRLLDAISIGIGGMVGGGIFAVLGLAVSLAKGGTPVAFLFAGIIALLTSYSYAKLSLTYPDRGGTVKYINEGVGKGVFSGGMNNLLWVSYIIMLSLYASAFGTYAPNLLDLTGDRNTDFHIYSSGIIAIAALINYYSIKVVGAIESYAVIIKMGILLIFVVIGLYGLSDSQYISQLNMHDWESPLQLLTGGMVIFVAYEGFELIANAASDIKDPEKNIPRAYYISVIFVVLLYIVIAIVTVGSLPYDQIKEAKDYVLAEAAKPMLGQAGFTVITIAALISTFSAINASLYGGSRVSFEIAEDDELPHEFTKYLWNQPIGLLITVAFTLLLTNTLNIENLSTTGSIGFLLIFAIVNYTGLKLSKKINGNKLVPAIGFIACIVAAAVLTVRQYTDDKTGVIIAFSIIAGCMLVEFIYKRFEKKNNR